MGQQDEPTGGKKSGFVLSPSAINGFASALAQANRVQTPVVKIPRITIPGLTAEHIAQITGIHSVVRKLHAQMAAQLAPTIEAISRLRLSDPGVFAKLAPNTAYSDEMTSPSDYFASTEIVVNNFDELHSAVRDLSDKNPAMQLLWRGQRDARWGMHSLLFRELMKVKKVRPPHVKHRTVETYPTEDDMIRAEKIIIDRARQEWRLDGAHPLEIFARLQHFGAPTRLIDVTRNPFIAAWFASASDQASENEAGRIFALATQPVLPSSESPDADTTTRLTLHEAGDTPYPFWHYLGEPSTRQQLEWGTGALRRFWVPPAYEQRMLAQNAAFILDGVPMISAGTASYFKKPGQSSAYWKKADLMAASSVYTKLYRPDRKVPSNRRRFAPTFTFRITAEGKRDIRKVLESRFSYTHATLYPDTEGLAQYLRQELPVLLKHSM
jgi:hypothetical protein